MFRIRRRHPRKMFGFPYTEVIASHHRNAAELARLRAAQPGQPGLDHPPILTTKPAAWSWRAWARYIDDTADELHTLRDTTEAPPAPADVLGDLLSVLEDIRDDLAAIRDAVENAATHDDLTALRDGLDKATDVLTDIRDDAAAAQINQEVRQ
ncbi:hypothetical protein [Nocardia cyriacigeorgica]|uniref:hypothetical protein n=1 Tax=Nocardia cyriacigeorgica TaxID=135487 RepID=UPI002456FD4B|nr:hypothetical protein [Nocardia cyriacigeorgica]